MKGSRSTSLPYLEPHPSGNHICHISTGHIELTNLQNKCSLVKEKSIRNNNFKSFSVSHSGMYVAVLARVSMDFELSVIMQSVTSLCELDLIICDKVCEGFKGTRTYHERVECCFSGDDDFIAVGGSMGGLFVVKRYKLEYECSIIPGLIDDMKDDEDHEYFEIVLSNERSFDFSPVYDQHYLAFATNANKLFIFDIDTKSQKDQLKIDTDADDVICCVKYSTQGEMIAVGRKDGLVSILCSQTLTQIISLDATTLNRPMELGQYSQTFPTYVRLCFSQDDNILSTTSMDGVIRLWQLPESINLLKLSRIAVLKYVKLKDLKSLPLPKQLRSFLYNWPT